MFQRHSPTEFFNKLLEDRPEEEGIETGCEALVVLRPPRLEDRPEEEGIETAPAVGVSAVAAVRRPT